MTLPASSPPVVEYAGYGTTATRSSRPSPGDRGMLVDSDGQTAHVSWVTGALVGRITAEYADDLLVVHSVPAELGGSVETSFRVAHGNPSIPDGLEDSLAVGTPESLRQVAAVLGPGAVLAAVASASPAEFEQGARSLQAVVTDQVGQIPSLQHAAAQLDEEEGQELIRLATLALVQEAFPGGQ